MRKTGIYAGLGYPAVPFGERISMIKRAGFDTVCLNFEKDMEKTETAWDNQVKITEKLGIPVHSVHLTGAGMTDIWKGGIRAAALTERTVREIRGLSELGITTGVIHVTWGFEPPAPPTEKALGRFLKIAETAERYGVRIALENSVFPDHLHFLLDNISSPFVGFCYDSGHENAFTPREDLLAEYGGRMFEMHLHDNSGNRDDHYVPFDERGTIDWEAKARELKKTAIFGEFVILEPGPQDCGIEKLIESSRAAAVRLASF